MTWPDDDVERVAKAIARMIPIDGSHWNVDHGHNFPMEYSAAEVDLIRAIAKAAILTTAKGSPP